MTTPAPNNGGPAFPEVYTENRNYDDPQSVYAPDVQSSGGMTLRQYYAAKAMAGMLADPNVNAHGKGHAQFAKALAEAAFDLADAMIAHEQPTPGHQANEAPAPAP